MANKNLIVLVTFKIDKSLKKAKVTETNTLTSHETLQALISPNTLTSHDTIQAMILYML